MERRGGSGEVSQEVGPRGQFWSAQGAGKWQSYPIHAMGGACRAEKVIWGFHEKADQVKAGVTASLIFSQAGWPAFEGRAIRATLVWPAKRRRSRPAGWRATRRGTAGRNSWQTMGAAPVPRSLPFPPPPFAIGAIDSRCLRKLLAPAAPVASLGSVPQGPASIRTLLEPAPGSVHVGVRHALGAAILTSVSGFPGLAPVAVARTGPCNAWPAGAGLRPVAAGSGSR